MFTVREVKYVPWGGNPADLVTLAEAAKITGLTLPGLIRAVERGVLTEVINAEAKVQGRRMLVRAEVEAFQVRH
jgi:hypothetical protein